MEENSSLWVFGYGSLCWHPGFHTTRSVIGHVKNFVRRFWQGNTTHRGVPGKPGRVATLVPEESGITWGVAYEITGEMALKYLNNREVTLGGYSSEIVPFYPKDNSLMVIPVMLYVASSASKDWAGPAPLHEIATQISNSSGPTGHNVEYLLRLAEFMKENVPEGYDEHLSMLESLVRSRIKESKMCIQTLMGENKSSENNVIVQAQEPPPRKDTFQFCTTTLPCKKLRCLNI